MKWFSHLKTINHHKLLVMKHCFRVGLVRQGLMHDLSKYAFVEFLAGAKYYQGDQSPNNMERLDKGYSAAWLHHKGKNKHHLEYWIDYSPYGSHEICGMKMPVRYVVEMFCDRVAASENYQGTKYTISDPYHYYFRSRDHLILHPKTRKLLEIMLLKLKDEGETAAFDYVRDTVLKKGYSLVE